MHLDLVSDWAEITIAASRLRDMQIKQANLQDVSTREMLQTVASVSVKQNEKDPRIMVVKILLVTAGGTQSVVSFPFRNS